MAEPLMDQTEQRQKITINEKDYFVDTLSDEVKQLLALYQRAEMQFAEKAADTTLAEAALNTVKNNIVRLVDGDKKDEKS